MIHPEVKEVKLETVSCDSCPNSFERKKGHTDTLCPSCAAVNSTPIAAADKPVKTQMTQKELITQYLRDETLKVDSIPFTEDGINQLTARLQELEDMAIEIKTKATVISRGLRERKAKLGKGIWDKGTLPMADVKPVRKITDIKEMTKFEKQVKGFIDSGYDDLELIEFFGKSKEADVKKAISRIRGIETK